MIFDIYFDPDGLSAASCQRVFSPLQCCTRSLDRCVCVCWRSAGSSPGALAPLNIEPLSLSLSSAPPSPDSSLPVPDTGWSRPCWWSWRRRSSWRRRCWWRKNLPPRWRPSACAASTGRSTSQRWDQAPFPLTTAADPRDTPLALWLSHTCRATSWHTCGRRRRNAPEGGAAEPVGWVYVFSLVQWIRAQQQQSGLIVFLPEETAALKITTQWSGKWLGIKNRHSWINHIPKCIWL